MYQAIGLPASLHNETDVQSSVGTFEKKQTDQDVVGTICVRLFKVKQTRAVNRKERHKRKILINPNKLIFV